MAGRSTCARPVTARSSGWGSITSTSTAGRATIDTSNANWNHTVFPCRISLPAGTNLATMTQLDRPTSTAAQKAIDWGRCLVEHERWLRAVILARTGEPQAVDEVWQEVSLAAIEQRAPLADGGKAPAWLHRLAVIRSIRYRRQRARQRQQLAR